MIDVSMKRLFHASADQVWSVVGDFNGLPRFMASVTKSQAAWSDQGAIRHLTMPDGSKIIERLEKYDANLRIIEYSIMEAPLPVKGYLSRMTVIETDPGRCELEWSATFEPRGMPAEDAGQVIVAVYSFGLDGLSRLFESNPGDLESPTTVTY